MIHSCCPNAGRRKQETQTPPRLWPLTLMCDFDLMSMSRKLLSLDVAYCIVPWYQVWCSCVIVFEVWSYIHFCDLWSSPVTLIICQGHFHFHHQMDVMVLFTRLIKVYNFTRYHHLFVLCFFYVTFDLHLWPSVFVMVTCTLVIICV